MRGIGRMRDALIAHSRGECDTPMPMHLDIPLVEGNVMVLKPGAMPADAPGSLSLTDTADVIACVRFARAHGAEIAVRGGGHSAAGLGVGDGALVIDLSLLRSTTVDPAGRTVRADGGCTWGDVDHAAHAFGLDVIGCASTGNLANAVAAHAAAVVTRCPPGLMWSCAGKTRANALRWSPCVT